MPARKSSERVDLWLPVLVGFAGALACFAVWGLLVADRRAQMMETSRETALGTRQILERGVADQVAQLRQLSDLWRDFGLWPLPEWTAAVDHVVDRDPSLRSISWIDLDDPDHRVAMGRGRSEVPHEPSPQDVEQARRLADHPALVGPERRPSGAIGYRIFLPVRTESGHAGILVARFDVKPFLDGVLRDRARGYAVSISWGDTLIYSRGTASDDPWQDWWRVEGSAALPFGVDWRVVHRPTPQFAAALLTPVPHYLLGVGLLLSAVLAVVAHQLRVIARQSRFLEASNRALEQRGIELESKVAERTRDLEDAVAELEAFNYSVSHDLRSPLGAILNFTAILDEDYRNRELDDEGVAILGRVRNSASRAMMLLENLLELSRAGRAALHLQPVDMTALAKESFAQVSAAQDDGDVELCVDPLPEVMADRTLMSDVFANLFSNALKYSRGREKRRIAVGGRIEGDECVYEVSDNGHGFDMRFVDKLYGLFERLHSSEEIEGTGVGLAMVARIVKRHRGRVWAEGWPDQGARFSFAIPRTPPESGAT